MMKTFGIFDTKGRHWIGDDNGPRKYQAVAINGTVFSAKFLAREAALFLAEQMKVPAKQLRARQLMGTEDFRHGGTFVTDLTAPQAMGDLGP